jgi:hypothetical protein
MQKNILHIKARLYLIQKKYIAYLCTIFIILLTFLPSPVRCQQLIKVTPNSTESTLGKQFILEGSGFSPGDQIVLIGSAPKTIEQRPAIDPSKKSANITAIHVQDTYAYIIEDSSTLHILDIEKPDDPRLLKSLTDPNFEELKQIWPTEKYLYLTDSGYGIRIVDVSDPNHPSTMKKGFSSPPIFPIKFYVKEKINEKIIYSIFWEEDLPSDPNIPPSNTSHILILNHIEDDKIELLDKTITFQGHAFDVCVKEYKVCIKEDECETKDILYMATGATVEIFDVTDPNNPTYESYIKHIPSGSSNIQRLLIKENTLYMGDRFYGIHIADISIPTDPQIVRSLRLQGETKDIYLCGSYALVANGFSGLQIINLYEKENRLIFGNIYTFGDATTISSYSYYIYVANGYAGLSIVEAPSLVHPNLQAYMNTEDDVWAITSHGDYAYISNGRSGLKIIQTRPSWDPNVIPTVIWDPDVRLVTYSFVKEYNATKKLVLYLADETKFKAYDISNSNISAPIKIKIKEEESNFQDTIMSIFVQGDYAYLANFLFGAQSLKIADPDNIRKEGFIFSEGSEGLAYDIVLDENNLAYLANDRKGLWIVDFQNPSEPVEKSKLTQFSFAQSLVKSKDYIYMTNGSLGINIIDVSNPNAPDYTGEPIDYTNFLYRVNNIVPPFNDFLKEIDIESDNAFPFLYTAGDYHGIWINYISTDDGEVKTIDFISLPYGASAVKSDKDLLYCGDDYGNFYIFYSPVKANIIPPIINNQIKFSLNQDLPAGYYDIFLITDDGVFKSGIKRNALNIYRNKVTLYPGLNILSYPGLVPFENAQAFSLLKNLTDQEQGNSPHIDNIWMKKTDSGSELFYVAYMNQENQPAGENFDILPLRGYLIYAKETQKKEYVLPSDPLNMMKAELIKRLKSEITHGQNLISLPLMQDSMIKSSDLIFPESQKAASAIQEWDVNQGKWHSGYHFFNKVNGKVKSLTGGHGYLVSVP